MTSNLFVKIDQAAKSHDKICSPVEPNRLPAIHFIYIRFFWTILKTRVLRCPVSIYLLGNHSLRRTLWLSHDRNAASPRSWNSMLFTWLSWSKSVQNRFKTIQGWAGNTPGNSFTGLSQTHQWAFETTWLWQQISGRNTAIRKMNFPGRWGSKRKLSFYRWSFKSRSATPTSAAQAFAWAK